jgi:hypothetical protein
MRHGFSSLVGLGLLLLLPPAVARSVVTPGAPATAAAQNAAYRVQAGRVSGVDLKRGYLAVDGQAYRLDESQAAFSDDRATAPKSGLGSLRIGDKVIVRSIKGNGLPLVVQLVVQD